jgi:hypothetical protein
MPYLRSNYRKTQSSEFIDTKWPGSFNTSTGWANQSGYLFISIAAAASGTMYVFNGALVSLCAWAFAGANASYSTADI